MDPLRETPSQEGRRRISRAAPKAKETKLSGAKARRFPSTNRLEEERGINTTNENLMGTKDNSDGRPQARKLSETAFRPVDKQKSNENFAIPPMQTMIAVGMKKPNEILMELCGKRLINFSWYHGLMPRIECESLLKEDGDFIVRRTTLKKSSLYCISVMHGEPKHFPLNYKEGSWTLFGLSGSTLPELVSTLQREKYVLAGSGAMLKNPIARPDYYLLHENIVVDKKLGAGAFGEVFTGTLKMKESAEPISVAIKMIKGQVQKAKLAEFVKEAKLMHQFAHQNCVLLHGVAPQEEPLMIVLELCPNGSLKSWLKKSPSTSNAMLMRLLVDAARGMCYLSQSNVIHRDLAARNCLLGKGLELKISDFGLSVAGKSELVMDRLKSVPIRWLSPETLTKGVFNTKTDVWSFGVLTWEIFTHCRSDPFPNKTNAEAKQIIQNENPPMMAPPEAPDVAQTVMNSCFEWNPAKRKDFVQLLKILSPDEKPPDPTKNSSNH